MHEPQPHPVIPRASNRARAETDPVLHRAYDRTQPDIDIDPTLDLPW